jgi:plastocyanin
MNKNVLMAIVAVIIIAVGGYFLFVQNQPEVTAPMTEPENIQDESVMLDNQMDEMGATEEDNSMSDDSMLSDDADMEQSGEEVKINLTGKNFEFSQKEIRVKQGAKVTVNFTSENGFHDWVVDEFNAATEQVNTGGSTSVTFVADKAGTFEYYCSVGQHREMGMFGQLIVE